jgi:hypothetical protein
MKWRLSALRTYLREKYKVDDVFLWQRIEDLVVKTILSAEPALHNGV